MPSAPLGWRQLRHLPLRLAVAVAGIAFAVLLIMMQLGFRSALFESTLRFHERFRYDIALFSPDSVFIVRPAPFSIRRLYQALGWTDVADDQPRLHLPGDVEEPVEQRAAQHQCGRHRPGATTSSTRRASPTGRPLLAGQDVVLFDSASRPEFGPVGEQLARRTGRSSPRSTTGRSQVVGLFEIGPSFGIDGTVLTSDDNWLRLFPDRSRDDIQLGLVRLSRAPTRCRRATACARTCRRTCWS